MYTELAREYGFVACAWDDGGDFKIMERSTGTWNELKDILLHTNAGSPRNPLISIYQDTLIHLTWTNVKVFDSIFIERKVIGPFTRIAQFSGESTSFTDVRLPADYFYYYRIIPWNLPDKRNL